MMPFVSIIVPVFNVENSLKCCVDSILSQTFKDFEIILVDDGSTDNSPSICDSYASLDARIRVIHQSNVGLSMARNRGMEVAQGKWTYFVDSDDWMEHDYLENFVKHSKDKGIVIQGFQYDGCRNGIVRYGSIMSSSAESIICYLFETNDLVGVVWDKFFRKDIIDNYKIRFEDIRFGEDTVFFYEYLLHVKVIQVLPTLGYHYVFSKNGLSQKRYSTEYYLQLLDIFIDKLDRLGISRKFRNKYIWNLMEYWLLYPNMKYAYDEFDFEDMFSRMSVFINNYQLWGAPKMSLTSFFFGLSLRYPNPRVKYKLNKLIHLYVRRSENRICGFLCKDFKKI